MYKMALQVFEIISFSKQKEGNHPTTLVFTNDEVCLMLAQTKDAIDCEISPTQSHRIFPWNALC